MNHSLLIIQTNNSGVRTRNAFLSKSNQIRSMVAGETGTIGVNVRELAVEVYPFRAANAIILRRSMAVLFVSVNEFDT